MKKIFILIAFVYSINTMFVYSQNSEKSFMNLQEFEKNKQAYIIKEAQLTEKEANLFFPLNSELQKKKLELHRKHQVDMEQMKNSENVSDEEYKIMLDGNIDLKMKEAELDKEYSEKFNEFMPPQKLFKAQQAERFFLQEELRKFRESKNNGRITTGKRYK